MNNGYQVIDFTELASSVPGEALEQLVRILARRKGLSPTWSGRGADQGRDLILSETLVGPLTKEHKIWLVSCKDKAKSGSSVMEKDLPQPSIKDKLAQHRANGFLLATTTTVSTAVKALLDSLDKANGGEIHVLIWDAPELTSMLLHSDNQDILRQFLPATYQRVKGLTSIEGALLAFRDQIPDGVWNEAMRILRPYSRDPLKGSIIWPFNQEVEQRVDKIIQLLLVNEDTYQAASETNTIEVEVFARLIESIVQLHPEECKEYLFAVINHCFSEDIRANAAIFLYENYEVTIEDGLRMARRLDSRTLGDLYGTDISDFIHLELTDGFWMYDYNNGISNIPKDTKITDAVITSLQFIGADDDKILFSGTFQANVIHEYRKTSNTSANSSSGEFEGLIDKDGMQIGKVFLKTTD